MSSIQFVPFACNEQLNTDRVINIYCPLIYCFLALVSFVSKTGNPRKVGASTRGKFYNVPLQ